MRKTKRLYVLLGVLAAVCVVTFAVSRYETKKEDIKASGEVVFTIDPDAVTALSWEQGSSSLAFTRTDGAWQYDGDAAFPVDQDKIAARLDAFVDFAAAYVIDDVTDYAQYGLDDPECTVYITTDEGTASVALGAYSTMDAQRYVSTGDGKVYLAASDPMELFSAELSRMIKNDTTPDIDCADEIRFTGGDEYTVTYDASGEGSVCADDVYFTDGAPLDTARVESYLRAVASLGLSDYATYTADEASLSFYGLDAPALVIIEGLTMYLSEVDVRRIFEVIAARLPKAEVFVETMNPAVAKRFKERSIEGSHAKFTWGVKHGRALAALLPGFRFVEEHSLTEGMAVFAPVYKLLDKLPAVRNISNKIIVLEHV